jgi:hypothetical protein
MRRSVELLRGLRSWRPRHRNAPHSRIINCAGARQTRRDSGRSAPILRQTDQSDSVAAETEPVVPYVLWPTSPSGGRSPISCRHYATFSIRRSFAFTQHLGKDDRLSSVRGMQFPHDMSNVDLGRVLRNLEVVGDPFVGSPEL